MYDYDVYYRRKQSFLKWIMENELKQLLLSAIVIALAFSMRYIISGRLLGVLAVSIAVIFAFVFHEILHRNVARKFGYYARYQVWPLGLALALALPIITLGNLVFAAPGAVIIYPKYPFSFVNKKDYGIISLSGPLANIILGYLAAVLIMITGAFPASSFVLLILRSIRDINLWLATFNLIPFPPLDGSKVFAWNKLIWIITFAIAAIPMFIRVF